MMTWLYLGFFLLAGTAVAQRPVPVRCSNSKILANFEVPKYLGRWYVQACSVQKPYEKANCDCWALNYDVDSNSTLNMTATSYRKDANLSLTFSDVLYLPDGKSGNLTIKIQESTDDQYSYLIIDTDYDSYAVEGVCDFDPLSGAERLAIVISTRDFNPQQSVLDKAYKAAVASGVPKELIKKTDNTDCCPAE